MKALRHPRSTFEVSVKLIEASVKPLKHLRSTFEVAKNIVFSS